MTTWCPWSQTCRSCAGLLSPSCLGGGSSQAAFPRERICAYSGGNVLEVTPVGKVFETRIAMMKSDTEMVTNGEPGGKIVH